MYIDFVWENAAQKNKWIYFVHLSLIRIFALNIL